MYILLSKTKNPPSLKLWRTQKGFTFIEVIIIFTIIFVMTAVLLSTSYKDRAKKELQATAREVTASIREAQNNALTGKQKGVGTMPCAFVFHVDNNGYQIMHTKRELDADNCTGATTEPFFGRNILPKNITMQISAFDPANAPHWVSVTDVEFDVPYGKITIGGDSKYTGAEVILSKDNKHYHLCVHSTGLIEDYGITENTNEVCVF